jgi:hypothetical protein
MFAQTSARIGRLVFIVGLGSSLVAGTFPALGIAEESAEPKSIRMTCGSCPDGYATTGVTQSAEICKEGDPTLVECVPLGANMLAVCGSCPEGYAEIGGSSVPSRCGTKDGGRVSQCQLKKMDTTLPDPKQGHKICPPDCGNTATPGQGALPPPPKYQQMPENK